MLKERARIVAYWVWTTDLVLTTLAFFLAWWLRSHVAPLVAPSLFPTELYPLSRYLGLLPLVLAIWTLLLVTREAYTSRRTVALASEVWQVVQVVGAGTLTLAAAGWLLRLDFVSRPFLILFATLDLRLPAARKAGAAAGGAPRPTTRLQLPHPAHRRHQPACRGGGPDHRRPSPLGPPADRLRGPQRRAREEFGGLPVLGRADDLPRILQQEVVDEVIFVLSRRQLEEFEEAFCCARSSASAPGSPSTSPT